MTTRLPRFGTYLLLVGAIATLGAFPGCGRKDDSNQVIATVDGQPIARGEFRAELSQRYGALQLKDLVDQTIVEQLARKQGFKLDEARLQAKMQQAIAQDGGEKKHEEKLAKQVMTNEMLRARLAREALAEQVMAAGVQPSEKDIRDYYQSHPEEFKHQEMIKGRLILLESRQNAQTVHDILKEPGADFAGLAKSLSIDPNTKDKGGDMGWIERDDYNPKIADAAFKLAVGQYSDVIEYPDGFAIVLVEAKQPAGVRPLAEVQDTIKALIARDRESQAPADWAILQRQRARIRIHDAALRRSFDLIREQ